MEEKINFAHIKELHLNRFFKTEYGHFTPWLQENIEILGNDEIKQIAMELVRTIKSNITIDWTLRENVQAKMRVAVKRILKKHKYPSDTRDKAVKLF